MDQKFELYKIAVEMADRVSTRRMTANGFFLTVNSTLLVLQGYSFDKISDDTSAVLVFMSAVGIVLSFTWFFSIRSYKKLNKAKYSVILEIESTMDHKVFTDEWENLKRPKSGAPKKWRQNWIEFKDRYTDLSNIESIVPILFGFAYIIVIIAVIMDLRI